MTLGAAGCALYAVFAGELYAFRAASLCPEIDSSVPWADCPPGRPGRHTLRVCCLAELRADQGDRGRRRLLAWQLCDTAAGDRDTLGRACRDANAWANRRANGRAVTDGAPDHHAVPALCPRPWRAHIGPLADTRAQSPAVSDDGAAPVAERQR